MYTFLADMNNSIEGAIDIDFLTELKLPLIIDKVNLGKLTLPLILISLHVH